MSMSTLSGDGVDAVLERLLEMISQNDRDFRYSIETSYPI